METVKVLLAVGAMVLLTAGIFWHLKVVLEILGTDPVKRGEED